MSEVDVERIYKELVLKYGNDSLLGSIFNGKTSEEQMRIAMEVDERLHRERDNHGQFQRGGKYGVDGWG